MKKILMVLGVIALLLIIFAAGGFSYIAIMGSRLDASSKAYMDANIPTIISTWSKDELEKRASEEFREGLTDRLTDQQWNLFLSKVKPLGTFETYEGSKGQAYISLTFQKGKVVTAHYTASASFKNGPAEITVKLIQRNGQWQILSFTIDSPIFYK
jgi:hypothetical protein